MHNMRTFLYIILLAVVSSCTTPGPENAAMTTSNFKISGHVKNAVGSMNISEVTPSGLILIDSSAILEDGSFELNGSVSEKTFCALRLPKGDILLVVDSGASIEINADAANIEGYAVTGSDESEELRKLMQINYTSVKKRQDIEQKYGAIYGNNVPPEDVQEKIQAEVDSIASQNQSAIQAAVAASSSIVPLFAINFMMPYAEYAYLQQLDEKFFSLYPNSKYSQVLHNRVAEMGKTALGAVAPEIKLSDPFGKEIALSSLRGKIVLIDFWASWCSPCRAENPNVVKLYNKYKDKGFDIFSVSLDKNREAWIKAINDDKLLWNHVSDLMEWNTPLLKTYNFDAIPFTVLIDKEGKIIATKLRGKELEKKLAELFGS